MSKERLSASVDKNVADYLSRDTVNASGLINQLVKEYMEGGSEDGAILRLREQQVRSEVEELKKRKVTKESELERITEMRESAESGPDLSDTFDAFLDDMENDGVHVWPECEPVAELAREYDISDGEVMERLKCRAAKQDRDIMTHQFMRADVARRSDEPNRPITEVDDV